jgi:hypothetical protein
MPKPGRSASEEFYSATRLKRKQGFFSAGATDKIMLHGLVSVNAPFNTQPTLNTDNAAEPSLSVPPSNPSRHTSAALPVIPAPFRRSRAFPSFPRLSVIPAQAGNQCKTHSTTKQLLNCANIPAAKPTQPLRPDGAHERSHG